MELREYRPEDCEAITRLFYDTVHTVNRWDYAPAHVHQQILHGATSGVLPHTPDWVQPRQPAVSWH